MSLAGMSIIEQDELIKTLSNEQLQNYAQNPDGRLPLYLVIAQLKRNEDTKQRFAALQAEQQNAQQPRTVAARLAPRPGEMPVPASQAAASPAPQMPLPQAGGAPQIPTVNAQHGMDYEKLMKAVATVAAAEEDEEEDLTKPDFFGSEKGSFERGGETSTAQYPANVMAALRKAMAEEERGRVHEGFEAGSVMSPQEYRKGKKKGFTKVARHARTPTGYAFDPLKLAMESGLADLKKRKKRPTVNAAFGFPGDMKAEEDRWLRAGRPGKTSENRPPAPLLSQEFGGVVEGVGPERVELSNLADAKRAIQDYAPRLQFVPELMEIAEVEYDEALQAFVPADEAEADDGSAVVDTGRTRPPLIQPAVLKAEKAALDAADAARALEAKTAPADSINKALIPLLQSKTDGTVAAAKPQPGVTAPEEAGVELTDAAYAEALQLVEGTDKAAVEAEQARLAKEAQERRAQEIKDNTATVATQVTTIQGLVGKNIAESGKPVDQDKITPNIGSLITAIKNLIGNKSTTPDQKVALTEFLTNTRGDITKSRKARDGLLREAMETTAKASTDAIGNAEKIRNGIKEFNETGRLPKGRRDSLLNKLLLTWASSLLGNPTLADAMSQGFAASINVIDGEQENYSKAMMDNLEAEKAIGDLKVKAAASKQAALLSIAKAKEADIKEDYEYSLKMVENAANERKNEMTHQRGLVQNLASLVNSEAQMRSSLRPTETQFKEKNLKQAIGSTYQQYLADFMAAQKQAIKEGKDPLQATRAVSEKYDTHFNYNKAGVLDPKAWKVTSPIFTVAARLGDKAGSSYATENLGLKYGAMTTKAAGLVFKRDPEMSWDKTTMAVLESIAGEKISFGEGGNFDSVLSKHDESIRRNFSKLYRARKKWEETGRRGPDPVGGGARGPTHDAKGKRIR